MLNNTGSFIWKCLENPMSLKELYNFVRMLDAETYPKALINYGKMKIEFKNAKIKNNNSIDLKASIKLKRNINDT